MSRMAELHADLVGEQPPPAGHNNPPEPTPYELAVNAIEGLTMEAKNWLDGGRVASEVEAESIGLLMDSFRRAAKDADAARKLEAKPFDDGKAAVQARYVPLLKRADTAIDVCKAALKPWLEKLDKEKRDAAEAARQAAEEARRAAAEAILTAAPSDLGAREAAEALAVTAKRAETAANVAERDRGRVVGGARATTLRSSWAPVLMDGVIAARHYWAVNREACEGFFQGLAEADVRAGKRQIPGFEVQETRSVV